MTPWYTDDAVTVWHGDCLDVLAALAGNTVDAVVTDPPYGLEFMGKEWDAPWQQGVGLGGNTAGLGKVEMADGATRLRRPSYYGSPNPTCRNCGGLKRGSDTKKSQKPCRCDNPTFDDVIRPRMLAYQQWCQAWAEHCLRVLKPGGHLVAFGGTRTHHRLTCAIEDAGFEIREGHIWLYGQGFPKSLDVGKAIDRRQCVLAGTHVESREHICPPSPEAEPWRGWGTATKPSFEPIVRARKSLAGTVAANVLAWGTGALNIDAARVEGIPPSVPQPKFSRDMTAGFGASDGRNGEMSTAAGRWPPNVALDQTTAAALDRESGVSRDGVAVNRNRQPGTISSWYGTRAAPVGDDVGYGGEGGASRFFPVFRYEPKAPTLERPRADDAAAHPTVKPLDLMRWLVRLVTPPNGVVLDPFLGSGTTAEACIVEGFRCVGVEREAAYLPMIRARLTKPIQPVLDLGEL